MSSIDQCAKTSVGIVRDVRRRPSLQIRSLQILSQSCRRRASSSACGRRRNARGHRPGTRRDSIPRTSADRGIFALLEVERVPDPHGRADVERERQRVCDNAIADRLHRVEIGADREHVVARHLGVGVVRHRRIEPRTVAVRCPCGPPCRTASSVQAPIPVSRSGVMFGATILPNGVSIGRPPAKGWLLPRHGVATRRSRTGSARYRPRSTLVKSCGSTSPATAGTVCANNAIRANARASARQRRSYASTRRPRALEIFVADRVCRPDRRARRP